MGARLGMYSGTRTSSCGALVRGEDDSDGEEARRAARSGTRKKRRRDGRRERDHGAAANEEAGGVNLEDPRFKRLFESHHFALDPTDPNFKATPLAGALLYAAGAR